MGHEWNDGRSSTYQSNKVFTRQQHSQFILHRMNSQQWLNSASVKTNRNPARMLGDI
jgi:hypothetical protein